MQQKYSKQEMDKIIKIILEYCDRIPTMNYYHAYKYFLGETISEKHILDTFSVGNINNDSIKDSTEDFVSYVPKPEKNDILVIIADDNENVAMIFSRNGLYYRKEDATWMYNEYEHCVNIYSFQNLENDWIFMPEILNEMFSYIQEVFHKNETSDIQPEYSHHIIETLNSNIQNEVKNNAFENSVPENKAVSNMQSQKYVSETEISPEQMQEKKKISYHSIISIIISVWALSKGILFGIIVGFFFSRHAKKKDENWKKIAARINLVCFILGIFYPTIESKIAEFKYNVNTKKEQEILEEQNEPEVLIEVDIPDNSVVWNGHSYYYFERDGITWEEAQENCEQRGGHLVSITSQEEQDVVYRLMQKVGFNIDIWIGIWRNETESPWSTWVTGEPVTYTNWGDGEPDEFEGQCYGAICNGERYGEGYFIEAGQWDDLNNDDPSVSWGGYICEWDMTLGSETDEEILGSPDYIIPDSNSRYLEESDLENLSAEEIRIARNEIYARHGRMFADEDMQAYFNSKDWYTGTIPGDEFDESMLNDYERENTYLIVDYEAKMGY